MNGWIDARFGTARGAVRLALSWAEVGLGLARMAPPDPQGVQRLVFVCHGNICRSAYAAALARRAGYRTAGFGLSTSTGQGAHPPLAEIAARRGVALDDHRSTALADFVPQSGDLLIAMEVRHLRRLSTDERLRHLPRTLLGCFLVPPLPHLHDPYELSAAYTETCLARIEQAVPRLLSRFPSARAA